MLIGFAIFLISAGALGYEILLMRLFSIIQWHHFAYMIISLALLGFGASGTFIALTQRRLIRKFHSVFTINALLFSLTSIGSYAVAQRIPFNPLEILWDKTQMFYLLIIYLLLSIPFFCAANCIGLSITRFRDRIGSLYRFDLLGAGTGALVVILLLYIFFPGTVLKILSSLGFFSAGIIIIKQKFKRYAIFAAALFLCGLITPIVMPDSLLNPRISEYKGLSRALRVPGSEVISEHSSPLGLLTVVRNPVIPFREAPGLSLNYSSELPEQLAVFTDGDSMSPVTRYNGKTESLAYLDYLSSALAYRLLDHPSVLVLGAGGGTDVLTALYHQAKSIDAVEINPMVIDLAGRIHADFAGNLYQTQNIEVHVAEARGFVAGTDKLYDLINISLLDSFAASASGGHAVNETYLYTVEALVEYIRHLYPGGILAITRWLKIPPRDSLKLFAACIDALRKSGIDNPRQHLVMIRSWKTSTILVKNGEFSEKDIRSVQKFCVERSFDTAYYPGIQADQVNIYNILERPYLYEGAVALLGSERNDYINNYKFNIVPATDNRPFFFDFFKWKTFPEIFSLKGQGGLPLLEWTFPVLVITFVFAVLSSLAFILIPLSVLRRIKSPRQNPVRIALYFLFLGLGFLFIEIAFFQRFILFLSYPVYSIAVILCSFLVFAGLGSGCSSGLAQRIHKPGKLYEGMPVIIAVAGIAAFTIIYIFLLPPLFKHMMYLHDFFKISVTIALIAPLAFSMGMPFPLGLLRIGKAKPGFVPWAWGINGCASVLSSVLAAVLSIHFGFIFVTVTAIVLYVMAAFIFWKSFRVR